MEQKQVGRYESPDLFLNLIIISSPLLALANTSLDCHPSL